MEKLTVSEVTDLLRARGIPDSFVAVLAGMLHTSLCMCVYICNNFIFTENHIDGTALVTLPEDFEEFKLLLPSSGLRMCIKTIIRNWHSSSLTHEICIY